MDKALQAHRAADKAGILNPLPSNSSSIATQTLNPELQESCYCHLRRQLLKTRTLPVDL